MKPWLKSKTVWGLILLFLSFWGEQAGLTLDMIVTHLQAAWDSLGYILVVLGLRQADKPLANPFTKT
jgi:hypothetical protein